MLMNARDTQLALRDHLSALPIRNPMAVTLTCKQRIGSEALDEIKLQQNIGHFLNRLNYRLFKKAFSRFGKQLGYISVIEGNQTTRLHVHMMLERPDHVSPEYMDALIYQCWNKTKFGYTNTRTEPVRDDGWLHYILKYRTKSEGVQSSLDWNPSV